MRYLQSSEKRMSLKEMGSIMLRTAIKPSLAQKEGSKVVTLPAQQSTSVNINLTQVLMEG